MSKDLVIIGAGHFGQLARDYFTEFTDYNVVAFSSNREFIHSPILFGLPHVSIEEIEDLFPPSEVNVFVAIGYTKMNRVRERIYHQIKALGYSYASFVYPDVKIWSSTEIGENVFIFEDNTVQPYSKIGSNNVFWSGNHIGHHSVIGSHCFISSHVVISGNCEIGNNVFMGVNSTLHDNVKLGDFVMIGSDASVHKSIPDKGVVLNPATKLFPRNSDRIGV